MSRDDTIVSMHRRGVTVREIADTWDIEDDEVIAILKAERAKDEARTVAAMVGEKHPPPMWIGEED